MSETNTVPLADADFAALKAHATFLGLEVKNGQSNQKLRALILAARPDTKDIPLAADAAPPAFAGDTGAATDEPPPAPTIKAIASRSAGSTVAHYNDDPKVELTVARTADQFRAKDVTIGVNGDVFRIQRGQRVSVAYRVYLALEDAKEHVAVDTDEINPHTGMPIKEWQEVHSYPFSVHKMPSDEEIAAWHARTDNTISQAEQQASKRAAVEA
jgi:hypothetical protein